MTAVATRPHACRARADLPTLAESMSQIVATARERVLQAVLPHPGLYGAARTAWWFAAHRSRPPQVEFSYLLSLARTRKDVFFIQVGANDGLQADLIHHFVRRYGWRGIAVEPVPQFFDALVKNYAGADGLIFENKAVAEQEGWLPIYRLRESEHLPEWHRGLASFDRNTILSHATEIPDIESYIVEEMVEAVPVRTLLARHDVSRIDLVLIDTEGYDYKVLKQFDLVKYRPALVIYENKHLSPDEYAASTSLLEAADYRIHAFAENTVAIQPNR
jgi:FkbM family methyltransferase